VNDPSILVFRFESFHCYVDQQVDKLDCVDSTSVST